MTENQKTNLSDKGFDGDGFYRALEAAVTVRDLTWKQVSTETGVSTSTLARMAQGKRPDAASLAALSAWAGINAADFVNAPYKGARPEALTQISTVLRNDPNLEPQAAKALEEIVRAAYANFRIHK